MVQEAVLVPLVWILAFGAIEILAHPAGPREFSKRVGWDMCVAAMGIYVAVASQSTPPAPASVVAVIAGLIVILGVLVIRMRRTSTHTVLQGVCAIGLGVASVFIPVTLALYLA